jgi:type II secretion system protein C
MALALPFNSSKTWLARLLEPAPPLASLGLALVCGYLVARLLWALVPVTPTSNQSLAEENIELTPTQNAGEQIAQVHLFGEATQTPTINTPPPSAAPASHLKLIGVVTGHPGFAIIENAGKQKAYRLNETIEGTHQSLANIDTKAVKLSSEGSKTLTELKMPDLAKANPAAAGMVNADMPQEMAAMPEDMPLEAEPVVVEEPPVNEQAPEMPPEQVPEATPPTPAPTHTTSPLSWSLVSNLLFTS